MDKNAFNDLIQSLSRVFKSFPASLTESGVEHGDHSDGEIPDLPKQATITIMTVGKSKGNASMIPRMKRDSINDGPIGSAKRGSKGE